MAGKGTITRKDIASDEVMRFGSDYAKNLQQAIDKTEELKKASLKYNELASQFSKVKSNKEFLEIKRQEIKLTQETAKAEKERNNALIQAQKIKTEKLKTEKAALEVEKKKNDVKKKSTDLTVEERNEIITKRIENSKLNKEIKEEIILNSKNSSQTEKAIVIRKRAISTIQSLIVKKELGIELTKLENIELSKAVKVYQRYDKAIKIAKNSTGQFQENVGKYPKSMNLAINAFKRFLPLIGAGIGFREAWNFTQESLELASAAKGVEFAFKRIELRTGKAQKALIDVRESTRGLLSDLDIKTAIVELDNFNISAEETDTLMEFLAVRAHQTGDSIDSLKDSLVEGLSKESKLRIDNLGISASELNDELEKTPDFVTAVANIARKEIAEAGNILDEAANSQEKFNADLNNFQIMVAQGFISRASDAVFAFGSNILKAITPVRSLSKEIQKEQVELNLLVNQITDSNTSNEKRNGLISKLKKNYPIFLQYLGSEKDDNKSIAAALKDVNQLYIKRIALQSQQDKIERILQKSGEVSLDLAKKRVQVDRELSKINATVFKNSLDLTNKTFEERLKLVRESLSQNAKYTTSIREGVSTASNQEAKALNKLNILTSKSLYNKRKQVDLNKELTSEQELLSEVEKNLGTTLGELNKLFASNTDEIEDNKKGSEGLIITKEQLAKDAFDLEKLKKESAIEAQGAIIDNEKATTTERLIANKEFVEKSIELLNFEAEEAKKNAKGRADKIKEIDLQLQKDLEAIEKQKQENAESILEDAFEKQKELIEKKKLEDEKALENSIKAEQEALRKKLDDESLTLKEREKIIKKHEEAVAKIKQSKAEENLKKQIELLKEEVKKEQLTAEQRAELNKLLHDAKIALSDLTTEGIIADLEKQKKAEQEILEYKQEQIQKTAQSLADSFDLNAENLENFINGMVEGFGKGTEGVLNAISSVGAIAGDILGSVYQGNIDQIDQQIAANDEYYQKRIEAAEGDEEYQDQLRDEQEKKRTQLELKKRKEQEKQAKFQKAAAIFQIGMNTAQAILGIWAQVPKFDFGISAGLMTGIVSALGVAQIAAVAAKPIPKYEKGTEFHPGGAAEVAEVRPEVIMEPNKEPYLVSNRSVLDLPRGTKVVPSFEEYQRNHLRASVMASLNIEARKVNSYQESKKAFDNSLMKELIQETRELKEVTKRKNTNVFVQQQKPVDFNYQIFRLNNTNWT